jgi:hypothetical protein
MRNSKVTEIVCGLAAVGALAVLLLSTWELPPRTPATIHEAIGKALVKEALSLVGSGGQIIVISRDTEAFPQPAAKILFETVEREIRKANIPISVPQQISVDPLRPVQVPPGDFFELIRKAPAGSVILSLLGPPLLSDEQRSQLGSIKPKIVAFCSAVSPDKVHTLFNEQLLHAAVIQRAPGMRSSPRSTTADESFDQLYASVTAANLSQLSGVGSATP